MKRSDRVSALFFLLLSLFLCQQSIGIGLGTLRQPGPGLLAFGTGAGIGILALWLLIQSIISKESRGEASFDERAPQKGKPLVICLSLFGYTIAVNWLGFVVSTFIFVLFMLRLIEPERWWLRVMKATLITIGNYMVFVMWLGIDLPKGFWAR